MDGGTVVPSSVAIPLAGHSVSSHEGAVCWTPALDWHDKIFTCPGCAPVCWETGLLGLGKSGELEGI